MGSIKVNSKEKVGEVLYETEYTFSDAQDFFAWEDIKVERLTSAVRGFGDFLSGESPFENEDAGNVTEIKVAKKAKETKH